MAGAAMTPYQSLLVEFQPRPIRTDRDYRRALRQVELLMSARPGREASELIEVLSTLIEQYESRDYPTPENAPRELLAHYLENRGLSRAELARRAGIPRSLVTNVLSGRRGISKAMAARLSRFFGVPISLFIETE